MFKKGSLCCAICLLASCASGPKPQAPVVDVIERSSGTSAEPVKPRKTSDPLVVAGLQKNAADLQRQGEPAKAAAVLERALRVQPRNPQLWHELARVRYSQKRYQQAESLALRSNQYAQRRQALQHANWLLIADTRDRRGDRAGAAAARKRAGALGGR